MPTTDTVVIGAGQAGLAVSRCLTDRGVDHVVLERGPRRRALAQRALGLAAPAHPELDEPPARLVLRRAPTRRLHDRRRGRRLPRALRRARSLRRSTRTAPSVESLRRDGDGFDGRAPTDGVWRAANVVIATGWCDQPGGPGDRRATSTPAIAPGRAEQLPQPGELADGGVLVVGASATGVQLADELRTRRPRRRARRRRPHAACPAATGAWTSSGGSTASAASTARSTRCPTRSRARREPSLQLVGRPDRRDRRPRHAAGRRRRGSPAGSSASTATSVGFADDLARTAAAADAGCAASLAEIDAPHRRHAASPPRSSTPEPLAPVRPAACPTRLDLRAAGSRRSIWATGHRRSYPWLHLPVLDGDGEIRQRRGVTPVPGLYVLGQRFQHRRNSNFIDGVGRDAAFVADHLARRHRSATRPLRTETLPCIPTVPRYDVVVVGARAAGAATAMLLARPGLRVLVVDRGRYGADTLSTHALMRGGVLQLHRWGLLDRVVAAGTPPIRRTTFRYGAATSVVITIKPSYGVDALYAPRRTVLDPILVDAAADGGRRRPLRRHRHRRLPRRPRPGRAASSGATRDGRALAVDAGIVDRRRRGPLDGRRPRRRPDRARRHRRQRRRLRLLVRPRHRRLRVDLPARTPSPGSSRPTTARPACSPARPRRASGAAGSTSLREVVADSVARCSPPGSPPRPRPPGCARSPGGPATSGARWGPGWALVGDAGYWKDPISAHGLTDALRDAELLARAVARPVARRRRTEPTRSPTTRRPATASRASCSTSSTPSPASAGPTTRSPSCCCSSARRWPTRSRPSPPSTRWRVP